MAGDDGELGVYFKCLKGANAHFALTEPNSFALQDAVGRDWVCYPVPPHVVEQLDMLSVLAEIDRADENVGEQTDVRLVFCQRVKNLPEKLAEETG
jgi:hypothetical protein